tara:strand:- start:70 stop:765 length:696 start_codon:yes stop_codon:yes gene_type:complete
MKKEEQVVILPTDKAENCLIRNNQNSIIFFTKELLTKSYCSKQLYIPFHLYITTDEDFMSGEWVLFSDVVMIAKSFDDRVVYDGEGNSFMKYDCKKIIATTDPKLRSDSLIEDPARPEDNLLIRKGIPQIPQSLIESYCKNPVDKVMIEYTLPDKIKNALIVGNLSRAQDSDYILKVDSHNEIIISVIEERLYDRDEMWQCVAQSHITRKDMKNPFDELPEWFDKWVKETL